MWKQLHEDGPETKLGKEAKDRITELEKRLDGKN
jgi:hypothetical protein